jgi:hypothetical protein
MPTCKWSLLCTGAAEPDKGSVHAGDNAQLAVTFGDAGKISVVHGGEGKTITIEGAVTLKKIGDGDIRFLGDAAFDMSGVASLSGKLVFDLSKDSSFEVSGQANHLTGEMRAGALLTIRF